MNIPDAAIEAAAKFLFSRDAAGLGVLRTWEQIPEASRRHYATDAQLALEGAAPFIAAQAVRVTSLASRGQRFPTAPDVTLWLDGIVDRFERDEMDEA